MPKEWNGIAFVFHWQKIMENEVAKTIKKKLNNSVRRRLQQQLLTKVEHNSTVDITLES